MTELDTTDSQTGDTEETVLVTSSRVPGLCSSSYFFPKQVLPRYCPGWGILQPSTAALWLGRDQGNTAGLRRATLTMESCPQYSLLFFRVCLVALLTKRL